MNGQWLRNAGLTNELFDLSDLAVDEVKKPVTWTYCSSHACSKGRGVSKKNGRKVAEAQGYGGVKKCPSCGSASFLSFKVVYLGEGGVKNA